ncbi:MAG TPA: PepSY domain-containing protein [Gammaproteobacteria bacterium]|nr:hypothetical protein [Gammaproteobacteria bacterium]MEC8011651.1 PepSY domain-containing protein [Pseudomonadota bacterium]HBF08071.1 PepSY domain-containing protein [Gammaproteobacteria bacterium]HCK94515.1 PepSY domain-containing protein [Gammaproteobacteria bacterium]|tara:strand:- start:2201 stop:2449 length:249 start_codon:yes stop_codon:yes gene_type:complete
MKLLHIGLIASGLIFGSAALADRVPEGSLPLSEIVKGLEAAGYGNIEYIRMDKKRWKVRLVKDGQDMELRIDPFTAQVLSQN